MVAIDQRERDASKCAGMGEAMRQAEKGLKLFKVEEVKEYDLNGATTFKEQQEAKINADPACPRVERTVGGALRWGGVRGATRVWSARLGRR